MIAWAFAVLRPIPPRILFTAIAIIVALIGIVMFIRHREQAAVERDRARQSQIIQEKTDAANRADDAVRKCITDPGCLLRDDGYQRK